MARSENGSIASSDFSANDVRIEEEMDDNNFSEIVSLKPTLLIKANVEHIIIKEERKPALLIPAAKNGGLHQRFTRLQNKIMKEYITPYFAILDIVRRNPDFCRSLAKWKEELGESFLREFDDNSHVLAKRLRQMHEENVDLDLEQFWMEAREYWGNLLGWFEERRLGDSVTKEELDAELDEYMKFRLCVNALTYDEEILEYGGSEVPSESSVSSLSSQFPSIKDRLGIRKPERRGKSRSLYSSNNVDSWADTSFMDCLTENSVKPGFDLKKILDDDLDMYITNGKISSV